MEEVIETRVAPALVWAAWERAHGLPEKGGIEPGPRKKEKFKYQIRDVKKGESFSIFWKTFFIQMEFNHSVKAIPMGSEIRYKIEIRGLFSWPVRWLIKDRIKENLSQVLKAISQELQGNAVR